MLLRGLWPPQATAIQASPAAVGMTVNVKLLLPFMAPPAFQTLTPTSQVPPPLPGDVGRGGPGQVDVFCGQCLQLPRKATPLLIRSLNGGDCSSDTWGLCTGDHVLPQEHPLPE